MVIYTPKILKHHYRFIFLRMENYERIEQIGTGKSGSFWKAKTKDTDQVYFTLLLLILLDCCD